MQMLNCPFCNSKISNVETEKVSDSEFHHFITCKKCMLVIFGSEKAGKCNLIKKWNNRHG